MKSNNLKYEEILIVELPKRVKHQLKDVYENSNSFFISEVLFLYTYALSRKS